MAIGDAGCLEQWGELSVRMEVAGSEGDGAFAMAHQPAGGGADGCEPIGNVLWVSDGG